MKHIILIPFMLLLAEVTQGQVTTFNKRVTGLSNLSIGGIEVLDDYYYTYGNALNSQQGYRITLSKFDTLGQLQFHKQYNNFWRLNYFPRPVRVNTTFDGNLLMLVNVKDTTERAAIIRLDTAGTILNEMLVSFSGISLDSILTKSLYPTPDSGFVAMAIVIDSQKIRVGIIKLDKYVQKEWEMIMPYAPNRNRRGRSNLKIDKGGGYLLTEDFRYCYNSLECPTIECITTKLDDLGNVVWTTNTNSLNRRIQGANDIIRTKDNGLVVASSVMVPFHTGAVSPHRQWGFVYKMDSLRNILWTKTIVGGGATWYDEAVRVIELGDSSLIIFGTIIDTSRGVWDAENGYVMKLSAQGDSLWMREYTYLANSITTRRTRLLEAKLLSNNGFLIGGDLSFLGSGGVTGWLIKLDEQGCLVPGCHTTTGVLPLEQGGAISLLLYPNPTTDYLNVHYYNKTTKEELTFCVVDLQGRVLQRYTTYDQSDKTYIVPVSGLVAGVYVLEVRQEGELIGREQFVKQ